MSDPSIAIPAIVTILGIIISTFAITHQITLQRRLGYITSMLNDDDIKYWYKTFLKDLRFIHETLELFPKLKIEEKDLELINNSKEMDIKLEFLTAYIRHVLRGDGKLRLKYEKLATHTDKCYEPRKVFTSEYYLMINDFTAAIFKGLVFHPVRSWFIALFLPANKRYSRIKELIIKLSINPTDETILKIELEVKRFMLGKW